MNIESTYIAANGAGRDLGGHVATHEQVLPNQDIGALNSAGGFLRSNFSSPRRSSQSGLWKFPEASTSTPPWMKSLKKNRGEGDTKRTKDLAMEIDKESKYVQAEATKLLVIPLLLSNEGAVDGGSLEYEYRDEREPQSIQRETAMQTSTKKYRNEARRSKDSSKKNRREQKGKRALEEEIPIAELTVDPASQDPSELSEIGHIDSDPDITAVFAPPLAQAGKDLLKVMDVSESFLFDRVTPVPPVESKADPPGVLVDEVVATKAVNRSNPKADHKKKTRRTSQKIKKRSSSSASKEKDDPDGTMKKRSGTNMSSKSKSQTSGESLRKLNISSLSGLKGESVIEWFRMRSDGQRGSNNIKVDLPTVPSVAPSTSERKGLTCLTGSSCKANRDPSYRESDVMSMTSNTTRSGDVFEALKMVTGGSSSRSKSPMRTKSAPNSSKAGPLVRTIDANPRRTKSDVGVLSKSSGDRKISRKLASDQSAVIGTNRPRSDSLNDPKKRRSVVPSKNSLKGSNKEKISNRVDSSQVIGLSREDVSLVTWTRGTPARRSKPTLEMFVSPTKKKSKDSRRPQKTSWEQFRERGGAKIVTLLTEDDKWEIDDFGTASGTRAPVSNPSSHNLVPLDFTEFDAEDFSTSDDLDRLPLVSSKPAEASSKPARNNDASGKPFFPITCTDNDSFWSSTYFP